MNPLIALAVVFGLVAVSTAIGLVWRARTGRVRSGADAVVTAADVASEHPFGTDATLLQFSTEFCAPCRRTAEILGDISTASPGVAHVDVDLTHRPELARRFGILQTPTTLLLDGAGVVRGRIGGAPRVDELRERLDDIIRRNRVHN